MTIHSWKYCQHCQRATVICGSCGSNVCSGGSFSDDCPDCEAAFEMDRRNVGVPEAWVQWMKHGEERRMELWMVLRQIIADHKLDDATTTHIEGILWPHMKQDAE